MFIPVISGLNQYLNDLSCESRLNFLVSCLVVHVQDIIWVQDESASVQVYVLNPCLVHLPRQMDQYLILTAACDHMLVSEDGTLTQSGSLQPFIAKSFQVQVPAGLNLQHRSVQDFAAKGCTTLKLRPREAGVAQLKVRLLTNPTLSLLLLIQIVLNVWGLNARRLGFNVFSRAVF